MKRLECAHCGCVDIRYNTTVNPNDNRSVKSVVAPLGARYTIAMTAYCNRCFKVVPVTIRNYQIPDLPPEELFARWRRLEEDLFITSVNYYRRTDDEQLGGEEVAYFSMQHAMKHIEEYIARCAVKTNDQTYHVFKVRYMDIPDRKRTFGSVEALVMDYPFEMFEPIVTIRI